MRLIAVFEHHGPAQHLVHQLKYRGVTTYADLIARLLSERVPPLPVTPVPRALSRRLRYGVDPAFEIGRRLARRLGTLMTPRLQAPIHARRRAGGDHRAPAPVFRSHGPIPGEVMIVDDVVTTGATLEAAIDALGRSQVRLAVAANVVV